MTQNQIAFFKAKEEQRHNIAYEGETSRHNRADEAIRYEGNAISREANVINQMHFERQDAENQRHNMAQEDIGYGNLRLGYAQLDETTRHNRAYEKETSRHNRVGERQTQTQLRQKNKEIQESRRHNKQSEHISRYQMKEQKRHNVESENVSWYQSREQHRHNIATENISYGELDVGRQNAMSNWQNAMNNMANTNLRSQELDLAKDRYSLDQWTTMNKTDSEMNRNRAQTDLYNTQNEYERMRIRNYYIDRAGEIISGVTGGGTFEVGEGRSKSKTKLPKVAK